jgi:hypothetical protein
MAITNGANFVFMNLAVILYSPQSFLALGNCVGFLSCCTILWSRDMLSASVVSSNTDYHPVSKELNPFKFRRLFMCFIRAKGSVSAKVIAQWHASRQNQFAAIIICQMTCQSVSFDCCLRAHSVTSVYRYQPGYFSFVSLSRNRGNRRSG